MIVFDFLVMVCVVPLLLVFQSAHVLAMAVQKIFPEAQVTIGPWIEKGFYYDFDMKEPFTEKDLKKIKKEMVSSLHVSFGYRFASCFVIVVFGLCWSLRLKKFMECTSVGPHY